MIEFSTFVAQNWNLSQPVAHAICEAFEQGSSVYFLSDYEPLIAAEAEIGVLAEIYASLAAIKELGPKKKRLLNALVKAENLDEGLEQRVNLCVSSVELDDMLLPYRGNQRTKAQLARDKGLGPVADIFFAQEAEAESVEALALPLVGTDPTLDTVETVLEGIKDILAERFAYDENVRAMLREFSFDEGYFEVIPKNKKDRQFAVYRTKTLPVAGIDHDEYLMLMAHEHDKAIRFKFCVPLFHVAELLREHFVSNPDFVGYDLVCEAIDAAWERLLEPIAERDVKRKLTDNAEGSAIRVIAAEILAKLETNRVSSALLMISNVDGKSISLVATAPDGRMLGATSDKVNDPTKSFTSVRVKQFATRYRPGKVVVLDNEFAESCQGIAEKSLHDVVGLPPVERFAPGDSSKDFSATEWMKQECQHLDEAQIALYAASLRYLLPLPVIGRIGVEYFPVHPHQNRVRPATMERLLRRIITQDGLRKGIVAIDAPDSVLKYIDGVSEELLAEVRKFAAGKPLQAKQDLLTVPGMTETVYRNIAGYIVVPTSEHPLDKTLVHPRYYELVEGLASELGISLTALISDPDQMKAFDGGEFHEKIFVDRKLTEQLRAGQVHLTSSHAGKVRRRLRLSEVVEGQVFTGKVTNLAAFGAFIDIGAECDGLVHISELADDYVESVEQVVATGDIVDARVVKVDAKTKRISLSMKMLGGTRRSKVRASSAQLHTLADHFNANR